MSVVKPDLLRSKQHFQILDGLRGVAAIAVVIFHFMEISVPKYEDSFIAHAFLAVDFFFCLSGFVIAYAYDQRLPNIGVWNFVKLRLIRLHPLVIIGSVIGILAFVFDPWSNLYQTYSGKLTLMFVTSCLMIPFAMVRERYFNLFHLNPPSWSLFWEYVANLVYAVVLIRLNKKILIGILFVAAVLLCREAYYSKHLGVGWGGDNVTGGGIRVLYSFLAGMLVYRLNFIFSSRLGFLAISAILLAMFIIPFRPDVNFIVESVLVIFCFPALIAFGAGARLKPAQQKLCKFLGDISYPLYMVHYPFIWLFMSYVEKEKPTMPQMTVITAISVVLLLAFAYVIMISMDIPIRKYLLSKMKSKQR